jgi:hypothetical protein
MYSGFPELCDDRRQFIIDRSLALNPFSNRHPDQGGYGHAGFLRLFLEEFVMPLAESQRDPLLGSFHRR